MIGAQDAVGKPRPLMPPWPSPGQIYHEGFDQPYRMPTNQVIDPSVWSESWSGWALERSSRNPGVVPWVVPMLATNGTWNLDPQRGVLRMWYRPEYTSGSGPGHVARLLTLVSARDRTSAVWWTLAVAPDGSCLQLLCETANGPEICASVPVTFQAGSWHQVALGYTETNCAIFLDDQEVAAGGGLLTVPVEAAPFTSLIIGSGLSGEVAAGQIDEFAAFTGRSKFRRDSVAPFGIDPLWEVQGCWARLSPVAQLGAVTAEEEAANRERALARRAALLAARQATSDNLISAGGMMSLNGGGGPDFPESGETNVVWLLPPIITGSNTVRLVVNGPTTNIRYDIYFTNALSTNAASWPLLAIGGTNQVIFDLTVPDTSAGFFLVTSNYVATSNPPPQVAIPVFNPTNFTGNTSVTVTVTCDTPGAVIYYTTNGATPTTADYYIASGGMLLIRWATTLKARAFRTGFLDSEVTTGTFNVNCPPTVFAGYQQVIYSPQSQVTLQGSASDDGQLYPLSNTWRQVSGPPGVQFGDSNALTTTANLPQSGIYVLELEARDGYWTNKSWVTVARSPAITVSLTAPSGGTFNVPTNIALEASTAGSSVNITQVQFYAGSMLIGTDTSAPWTYEWRNVPAGNHSLYAVATSDNTNDFSLASSPVDITVNFPTDIGRFTTAANDLTIPVAGLPITLARTHDPRFGSGGRLGVNARLDFELANVQKSGYLATGWYGTNPGSGINYCINEDANTPHLVTVTLREGEVYHFRAQVVFTSNGSACKNSQEVPTCYNFHTIRYDFFPVIPNLGSLSVPTLSDCGMDDNLSGWTEPLTAVGFDEDGWPVSNYEPALSDFTFTAPDGTQYKFDSSGKLNQRIDRNGNSLTYGSTNITHSTGKAIDFVLTAGRITQVRDPIAIASSGVPAIKYSYDASGHLTNVARLVDRSGSGTYESTAYRYEDGSNPHLITRVIDARGITTVSNLFDANGRLSRQYDALGNYTSYTYEDNGRRQVVTDRNGQTTRQDFNEAGFVESVQDAEDAVTSYLYDANGRRIAEVNPLGGASGYAYNERDELVGATNELSFSSSATYNTNGLPLTLVDAMGYGTTNAYDGKGNLLAVTNALGIVSRYSYDAQGNRKAETNAFGLTEAAWTLYDYDAFGNLTNVTDALGSKTGYSYDLNGNRLVERRERTLATGSKQVLWVTNVFDAANRVLAVIEPDGFTNRTVYNAIGKTAYTTNKLGVVTRFEHDARGLLTNTVFALGTALQASESVAYDAEGHRTNSVDRAGRTTTYSYDGVGRLRRTCYTDNTFSENQYDVAGRLYASLQGYRSGSCLMPGVDTTIPTRFEYDAAGRRTAVANALNQTNRYAYDKNGNQTNVVDALSRTNRYEFDRLNRQTKVTFPDTTSEAYGYDGLNRRVALTNQANIVTRFGYNKLGSLTAVTNGWGTGTSNWVTYAYDEVGNQTNQVDALNRRTRFEFDAMGRRSRTILPGNQIEGFAYDAVGNLTRYTNFNSATITHQYDALNRLTNKSSGAGYNVAFTYTATGQRASMTDGSGSYTFACDNRDRLLTNSGPSGKLIYTYDSFGHLGSIVSARSGGASLTYTYDALNRLSNVVDAVAGTATYSYDGVGNLQTLRYPNAVTNTYTYNSLNRLTNLVAKNSAGPIASFAYVLAAAGNRTTLTETVNSVNRTNQWFYDPLYRLTNETITAASGGVISYKYDAVGNRTNRTSTVSGFTNQTFSFTTNDWLTTDVYDRNGGTRTNGANVFFYDVENRLTNATVGGTAVSYTYNADGIRVSKTTGGATTLYLVDDRNPTGYAQVLEELTVSGGVTNLAKVFTCGLDLVAQRIVSSGLRSFYGYDGNGNTRYLTGTNAAISDTYAYDAFGTLLTSSGGTANDYLYSGEQYDSTLGLYYLRSRYLNAGTGRFWTRDAHPGSNQDPPSLHKYLYTGGNPVNGIDPGGHEFTISGLYYSMSAQLYLFAQTYATTVAAAKIGLTTLTLGLVAADSAGLLTADRSIAGIYLSGGGNPFSEAAYVIGEVRTLRTALIAARTVSPVISGFSAAETAIINEARQIVQSAEFAQIRAARAARTTLRVRINGRTIQYEPGAPWSALTWAEQRGFVLGEEAFTSDVELAKTVLHELHRLNTSVILQSGTVAVGSAPAEETLSAYQFAERAARKGL